MTEQQQDGATSILVVDDDETFRTVLARSLRSLGFEALAAGNYYEAIGRVLTSPPEFAVVDLQMPGHSGLSLIEAIKRAHPETIVVVLTADGGQQSAAAAAERGASGYLLKPTDADEVISALRAARRRPSQG
jgi:two-component system, response regulator RegA